MSRWQRLLLVYLLVKLQRSQGVTKKIEEMNRKLKYVGASGGVSDHDLLSNVTANQHHTKYTDAEAISAVEGEATLDLTGVIPDSAYPNAFLLDGSRDITGNAYIAKNDPVLYFYTASRAKLAGFISYGNAADQMYIQSYGDLAFGVGAGKSLILNSDVLPFTTDFYDLGSPSKKWKDFHVERIGYIDTVELGTQVAGNLTNHLIPTASNTYDLGYTHAVPPVRRYWRNAYFDGIVYTDAINELTSAVGVTIDSLLIKDGGLPSAGDITMLAAKTFTSSVGTKHDGLVTKPAAEVQTTDATQTTVDSISLLDENTYQVEAFVSGVKSDGSQRASYHIACTVYRTGAGNATLQGAVTSVHSQESDANWDATFTVNGNALRVSVTGVAATTIEWGCTTLYMNMSN